MWLLASVRSVSPQSKKGLHLWGLGWDFHFLETPSVLFCMVPPGTTVLIFLEGMFREPQSPRGKDNGGCDVTSILGASGGKKKPLGGLDEFSTAFPQGISQFKSTLTERGPKMAAPVHTHPAPVQPHLHAFGATRSLSSGSVNCVRGEKNRLTPNVPLRSFQTSRGTLIGVGLKMAASEVQRLFFHPAKA